MRITKEWLDSAILIDKNIGNYSISRKQTDLLYKWFPDLFYDEEGKKTKKSFVKNWPLLLCDKEITELQATVFRKAKASAIRTPHIKHIQIQTLIEAAKNECLQSYGNAPQHPNEAVIYAAARISDVHIQKIIFTPEPENLTVVDLKFTDAARYTDLQLMVEPGQDENGEYFAYVKLFALRTETEDGKKLLDEGIRLNVNNAINMHRRKKISITRKDSVPHFVHESKIPEKIIERETKKQQRFFLDFEWVNKKRKLLNLPELSIIEFGNQMGVDPQNSSTLKKYPLNANLGRFLK